MGEAKRRKQNDPNWGTQENKYLTDTYNVFRLEEYETTWKITNLELESAGFSTFSDDLNKAIEQMTLINLNVKPRSKQCWVYINNDNVKIGNIVLGRLSHHPADTSKGFATLEVIKIVS